MASGVSQAAGPYATCMLLIFLPSSSMLLIYLPSSSIYNKVRGDTGFC